MSRPLQFRGLLTIGQTVIAALFGGWGLWWRSQILSRSAFGWNSTVVYHVWPWPFRFAEILNVPAVLIGALVLWPIDKYASNLHEYLECSALLPFALVLWYWVGSRLDRRWNPADRTPWIALLTFMSFCLMLSLIPIRWSDFLPCGVALWLGAAIAILWATRARAGQVA